MNYWEKIQKLPESKRKIILWLIVIIIGFILLTFWVRNFRESLKNFKTETFEKEFNFPKLEIPQIIK